MVDSIGSSASCIFRYYPNYGLEKLVRHHYIIGSATTIIYNVRKCLTLIQLHKKRQTIFNIVNCLPSLRVGVTGPDYNRMQFYDSQCIVMYRKSETTHFTIHTALKCQCSIVIGAKLRAISQISKL